MKDLVAEYYQTAPEIVRKINAEHNADDIWEDLYVNLVQKCVSFYENDDINSAVELYVNTTRSLKLKYCGE